MRKERKGARNAEMERVRETEEESEREREREREREERDEMSIKRPLLLLFRIRTDNRNSRSDLLH